MTPWWLLLVAAALALDACALDPPKQWYKPTENYTAADFKRDEAACTRNRELDEACLKQRGWFPLGGDITPNRPPEPAAPGRPAGRY